MLAFKQMCPKSVQLSRCTKSYNPTTGHNVLRRKLLQMNTSKAFYFHTSPTKLKSEDEKVLKNVDHFVERHLGPNKKERRQMLDYMNLKDMNELVRKAIPLDLLTETKMHLDQPISEIEMLKLATQLSAKNKVWRSYIGMGFYNCHVPPPIVRNLFENPGWYTQYTPYQAEISQGRLESLVNFQTMVCDLTGMEIANASLLDEASACAEAVSLAFRLNKRRKFLVDSKLHPQNIAVVKTRAEILGLEVVVVERAEMSLTDPSLSGIVLQYPDTEGSVYDFTKLTEDAHKNGSLVMVSTDLLALTLLRSPGEFGADVVIGTTQRFGLPMGFGGPHSAFFATKDAFKRIIPGRIVGVTRDSNGDKAYRLALQTREQHIRRDKATSNICTAQALLANMSAMYAVYHGPERLKMIGQKVHQATLLLAKGIKDTDLTITNDLFFDTLTLKSPSPQHLNAITQKANEAEINLRYYNDGTRVSVSLDETVNDADVNDLLHIFGSSSSITDLHTNQDASLQTIQSTNLHRTSSYLTHPVFNSHHSEMQLMRYMKRLENMDVSLVHSMIPLGSCTMKLNSASEMMPCSMPGFSQLHPFVPPSQSRGYTELFDQLGKDLCQLTGFHKFSFQSNSGAQGEYSGLRTILAYLKSIGQSHRKVCLIPESAHGTNPASAHMCGMKIDVLKMLKNGDVDMSDLAIKVAKHKDNLAALMITYPSTHGVFDDNIREICDIIHSNGGQVYMDGANLNAQVGICIPTEFGADVAHLNLHKTFCIPHGGGGPGMGPIGVKEHLAPFLPSHPVFHQPTHTSSDQPTHPYGCINATPYGSSLILPIPWAYIKMMGFQNLKLATQTAILNANYMMTRLKEHYHVIILNKHGFCAHEFKIDSKEFKRTSGVEVVDIAKRLQDYGFHSPTMSFPVTGCLMIEPTESESKHELDRLCDTLISIRKEIQDIEDGKLDKKINPLKMAPHTMQTTINDSWDRPYSRQLAAFPASFVNEVTKFWPSIGRVDDVYGDQHLVCSCPPMESYVDEEDDDAK